MLVSPTMLPYDMESQMLFLVSSVDMVMGFGWWCERGVKLCGLTAPRENRDSQVEFDLPSLSSELDWPDCIARGIRETRGTDGGGQKR